jgi:hypothetical protein
VFNGGGCFYDHTFNKSKAHARIPILSVFFSLLCCFLSGIAGSLSEEGAE